MDYGAFAGQWSGSWRLLLADLHRPGDCGALGGRYLFDSLGLPLQCHGSAPMSLADLLHHLPQMRQYRSCDELGHDFFKLQCYFVTHFL